MDVKQFALRMLIKSVGEDTYLAVGLEAFIVAQGTTRDEAIDRFNGLLAAEVAYGIRHGDREDPLKDIPAAPQSVWVDWRKATDGTPIQLSRMAVTVHNDEGTAEPEVFFADAA